MNGAGELSILTSSAGWNALFGVADGTPALIMVPGVFLFFFFFVLFPLYFALGFTERKLAADLQARVGPNRTLGNGMFQGIADFLKLGVKATGKLDSSLNPVWFAVQNAILYSSFVFLPFGTALIFLDSEIGVFLPFICLAGFFLCSLFASEGSEELENEVMAHRQVFLWISAWIPAIVTVAVSIARAGSARWSVILSSQANGPFSWVAFSSPFGLIAFFVFLFSGLVALQLPPFHALDRDVRYQAGARLGLFGLNRFYMTVVWCLLSSALFLGGQAVREPANISFLSSFLQFLAGLTKASGLYILLRVVSRALPQLRQDQMTEFCWRVLTPVGVVCLIGELIWVYLFNGGAS